MGFFKRGNRVLRIGTTIILILLITLVGYLGVLSQQTTDSFALAVPVKFEQTSKNWPENTSNFYPMFVYGQTTSLRKMLMQSSWSENIVGYAPMGYAAGPTDQPIQAFAAAKKYLGLPENTVDPEPLFPQMAKGSSSGLMTALAYIDALSEGNLSGGKAFAGTGTITSGGVVEPIGMASVKLQGAYDQGFRVFFVPKSLNEYQIKDQATDLGVTLVSVVTLDDAVSYLCANGGSGAVCNK